MIPFQRFHLLENQKKRRKLKMERNRRRTKSNKNKKRKIRRLKLKSLKMPNNQKMEPSEQQKRLLELLKSKKTVKRR